MMIDKFTFNIKANFVLEVNNIDGLIDNPEEMAINIVKIIEKDLSAMLSNVEIELIDHQTRIE